MTERDEQASIPEETPQEVTGVVRLHEGENFFNQYPFGPILDRVVSLYDGSSAELPQIEGMRSDLAYLVNKFANRVESGLNDRAKRMNAMEFMLNIMDKLPQGSRRKYPHAGHEQGLEKAMEGVITHLARFPEWSVYIRGQQDADIYLPNGEYKPRYKVVESALPLSYLAWIHKRIETKQTIAEKFRIQAVVEEFPQQSVPGADRRDILQRWQIWGIRGTRGLNK